MPPRTYAQPIRYWGGPVHQTGARSDGCTEGTAVRFLDVGFATDLASRHPGRLPRTPARPRTGLNGLARLTIAARGAEWQGHWAEPIGMRLPRIRSSSRRNRTDSLSRPALSGKKNPAGFQAHRARRGGRLPGDLPSKLEELTNGPYDGPSRENDGGSLNFNTLRCDSKGL